MTIVAKSPPMAIMLGMRTVQPLDPSLIYLLLRSNGDAQPVQGGDAFWSMPKTELEQHGQSWLVSEFSCSNNWPSWEMHPVADELIYLLSGEAEFLLEKPEGLQRIHVVERGLVIVPRGIWHTAQVSAPSRMFLITMGAGTQHRPASAI